MPLSPEQEAALKAAPPETRYKYFARQLASKYGLDPDLFQAQIQQESGFKAQPGDSGQGALGIAQMKPATAKAYGVTADDLVNNPVLALDAAARHMKDLTAKYGDQNKALLAYHQGEPNVDRGTIGPKGRDYQTRITKSADAMRTPQAPAEQAPAEAQAAPAAPAAPPAPVAPVAAATPAAPAAPAAPAPDPGYLAHAGSALARGVAGVADIVGGAASGPMGNVPSLGAAIEPYLAPKATSLPGRMAEGAVSALPITAMTGGLGVGNLALGAAGGAVAPAGGDATEAMGMGRVPGELVGGALPATLFTPVRALVNRVSRRATEADFRQVAQQAIQDPPDVRAATLRAAVKNNAGRITDFNSSAWDNFMADAGQLPVPVSGLRDVTAPEIIAEGMKAGLSRDVATAKAETILKLLAPNGGPAVDTLPLEAAKQLRTEIGQIASKATKGSVERSAGKLYSELSTSIEDALPTTELKSAWADLNAITKEQTKVLKNTYVKSALQATPQGQAAADKYIIGLLESGFTPARQVEVRALAKAGGDEAKAVLGDALVRNMLRDSTKGDAVDWPSFAKNLRDPQKFRGLSMELLPASEQKSLLHLADVAENADPRSVLHIFAQGAGIAAGTTALSHIPVIGPLIATGLFGAEGLQGLRALRDPANRALLRRAAKTSIDAVDGRQILQNLVTGMVAGRANRPSAPGTVEAPSVPGTP